MASRNRRPSVPTERGPNPAVDSPRRVSDPAELCRAWPSTTERWPSLSPESALPVTVRQQDRSLAGSLSARGPKPSEPTAQSSQPSPSTSSQTFGSSGSVSTSIRGHRRCRRSPCHLRHRLRHCRCRSDRRWPDRYRPVRSEAVARLRSSRRSRRRRRLRRRFGSRVGVSGPSRTPSLSSSVSPASQSSVAVGVQCTSLPDRCRPAVRIRHVADGAVVAAVTVDVLADPGRADRYRRHRGRRRCPRPDRRCRRRRRSVSSEVACRAVVPSSASGPSLSSRFSGPKSSVPTGAVVAMASRPSTSQTVGIERVVSWPLSEGAVVVGRCRTASQATVTVGVGTIVGQGSVVVQHVQSRRCRRPRSHRSGRRPTSSQTRGPADRYRAAIEDSRRCRRRLSPGSSAAVEVAVSVGASLAGSLSASAVAKPSPFPTAQSSAAVAVDGGAVVSQTPWPRSSGSRLVACPGLRHRRCPEVVSPASQGRRSRCPVARRWPGSLSGRCRPNPSTPTAQSSQPSPSTSSQTVGSSAGSVSTPPQNAVVVVVAVARRRRYRHCRCPVPSLPGSLSPVGSAEAVVTDRAVVAAVAVDVLANGGIERVRIQRR